MGDWSRRGIVRAGLSLAAGAVARPACVPHATAHALSGRTAAGSALPAGAAVAIADMLDHCARVKPGQEVLILACLDGLYGGDNLVDRETIEWIQAAVRLRGANASVLWIDEPWRPHAWRVPPVVRAAMTGCDLMINHSFDLTVEEILPFRTLVEEELKVPMVRNFATTAPLLGTTWARTPHELVSEIRYQSGRLITPGARWSLTHENGTQLEGDILPARNPAGSYTVRRETGTYLPWPEWVHPPIAVGGTSGLCVIESMLSWWSRVVGIAPYFQTPIRLTIERSRIVAIEGGDEADAVRRFLASMRERVGDAVYDFDTMHFGVHPHAAVAAHQCPSPLHRRLIEHSHSSNIHVHLGSPRASVAYPYWMHCTGDLRGATFRVGDALIHDRGHLTALDAPAVAEVAGKYPGRPGPGAAAGEVPPPRPTRA